jgi:predicted amidohydrolase
MRKKKKSDPSPAGLSRRTLLKGATTAMAAGLLTGGRGDSVSAAEAQMQNRGGRYDVVPLRSEEITIGVVQSRVRAVDGKNPAPGLKENLKHMLWLIDRAQYYGGKKDLLSFHEFPLTGWDKWSRQEALNLALELPGPETEEVGRKAKEYNCYITFGTYAKDKAWPGHVLSISVIISPAGQIIGKHWKARNIRNTFIGFELFTSSVYDVLDRYVEMYGWDAVVPVARTEIGNISVTSCQWEPELYRALSVKGVELLVRTATGGGSPNELQVACRQNSIYGVHVNNAISPDNPNFTEDAGGGGTSIFGPRGEALAQANSHHETIVSTTIPIAAFRRRHTIPEINTELYAHVMSKYMSQYPPGIFSKYLPENLEETARYLKQKARW